MSKQGTTHGRPRVFSDGTIVFPKKGWEPPTVPKGYRRKSNNLQSSDAWKFIPVIEACEHRTKTITYAPCGSAVVTYQCALKGEVKVPQCQTCQK